jgi:hypothetical protein
LGETRASGCDFVASWYVIGKAKKAGAKYGLPVPIQDCFIPICNGRNIVDRKVRATIHVRKPNIIESDYNTENGIVRFCAPVEGHKLADWVDPRYDIGVYAASKTNRTQQSDMDIS